MSIDWRQFAEQNNLTIEEFEHEIFLAAAAIASMKLEEDEDQIHTQVGNYIVTVTFIKS